MPTAFVQHLPCTRHKLGTKDKELHAQSLISEFPYPTQSWGEYKFSNNLEL